MKKVFVTGASGMVGSAFIELYKDKYEFITPEYPDFDLTNKENVAKMVSSVNPDILINFAAYTNVSEAENQKGDKDGDCYKINVIGVQNLLEVIPEHCQFIQISTDMVFPGSEKDPGPYNEDHEDGYEENELTWYGYTKSLAEKEVLKKYGEDATILRLIYPINPKYDLKLDYLRKALALYDAGKLYPMFTDQQVSISFVDEIAEALETIIEKRIGGIFHASSIDLSTPFELVSFMLLKIRQVHDVVKSASLKAFLATVDNPVRYPMFGGLQVEKTEKELGIKFSSWRQIVDKLASETV